MSDWKAVDSAPKDGSSILLYARCTIDPHHNFSPVVGRWDQQLMQWKIATEYLDQSGELVPSHWTEIPKPPGL
jgi:hypothetical protein